MDAKQTITQLEQFRQRVYQSFDKRADATMELIDALSSDTTARSVVELSLSPYFHRHYSSVNDAIDNFFDASSPHHADQERRQKEQEMMRIVANELEPPQRRKFWLFGMDATPVPRRFAKTLSDRGFVYQPNTLRGNKPVTIGHQYSHMAFLPEKTASASPPWIVPLLVRRITTQETETQVGAQQVTVLMNDETLPFYNDLCVQVEDSRYSTPQFLSQVGRHDNLITIARLRSNRNLYRTLVEQSGRGHPTWYGECFRLRDSTTWGEPDQVTQTPHISRRGRTYTVHIQAWHNLLMKGKRDYPMHNRPFTLIRIRMLDADGRPVFRHTMWLVVVGEQRPQLSLLEVHQAYIQRYDLEHFFRFGKQRLLMAGYQTPDVEHEQNWSNLIQLAYVQLWLARSLANTMPREWERYLQKPRAGVAAPSMVQRDFGRIIQQIGTPAAAPKPRGKSPGRAEGTKMVPRERHPVVKKTTKALRAA
jgi:hypothetical protein